MRRHLQQIGSQLVSRPDGLVGWLLCIGATAVYLLCLEPSASFWDSGEFIAVAYRLQVGHPPGAPLYQLLAHLFTLLAGSNALAVAPLCNALSAVAAGVTVMMLYWTVLLLVPPQEGAPLLAPQRVAALTGALCYLFCDTAWFSAVESEVYSLAMLIASTAVWTMLRWYREPDRRLAQRWLLLVALLLGLGYCVHQLVLLTAPTLLLLFACRCVQHRRAHGHLPVKAFVARVVPLLALFFVVGLTPYLTIPIRAAAGTPINEGHPATAQEFKSYLSRDQYEKAPVYPRMWRHRPTDPLYNATWCGGDTTWVGNLRFYGSYQLTYMYLRYLMWNFSGRYNDRQGYGSPQNGQFVTGLPFVDRQLVATAARPPASLHTRGHNCYYMLPLLLGVAGMVALSKRRRAFGAVATLFLMGGVVLSVYLNHPCYEPRERDYAYILSFYAFCLFIAFGAGWAHGLLCRLLAKARLRGSGASLAALAAVLAVPALMACQNWDDHDRSHRHIAHDTGANMLNSCSSDEGGAVLFTYGDNDTFPLWYLQTVEDCRTDVQVENIGLMGWRRFVDLLEKSQEEGRPVYFTHYAYNQYGTLFPQRLQLQGNVYRLRPTECDSVACEEGYERVMRGLGWHPLEGVYVDEVGCKFLESYWRDVALLAHNLSDHGSSDKALDVLNKTREEIPLHHLQDVRLMLSVGQAYEQAGDTTAATMLYTWLHHTVAEQLAYFHTIAPAKRRAMPLTLAPREEVCAYLQNRATPH